MTFEARLRPLNDRPPVAGAYVLYWMQQSQRAAGNPALEHAIGEANGLGLPVVVGFGLMAGYPDANRRHYAFMLQGLQEVERTLRARGIGFVVRRGRPEEVALGLAGTYIVARALVIPFLKSPLMLREHPLEFLMGAGIIGICIDLAR